MAAKAPTLRRAMLAFGGVLAAAALIAAVALVVTTTVLSRETNRVAAMDGRLRASLRTKVALLAFARASDRADSERSVAAADDRAQTETNLHAALGETRRLASPDRAAQLDSLMRKGQVYIDTRKQLDSEGRPLGEIIDRSTPLLDAVFRDLDALIASDDAAVRAAERSARAWHELASAVGVAAGVLLLLGFGFAMVGTNVLVRRPLLGITTSIERFARGDETARTAPSGAREIHEIGATFNELADRLARQDRDRLTFLGGVAHDLRNPLSALKMATAALRRGEQPASAEKTAHTLGIVERQIDRLNRMVGDLLDATRIESGRLELQRERVDLRPIIRSVAELYRPVSAKHDIVVIEPDALVLVECDPTRLEQVVANLVSNAVKYSPRGGRVTVAVMAEGDQAIVSVTDEGMGIAPEEVERIFEPFRRSGRSRELVSGVGLGLSVARKIVAGHGGSLEVSSRLGEGSTFRVKLPRASGRSAEDGRVVIDAQAHA